MLSSGPQKKITGLVVAGFACLILGFMLFGVFMAAANLSKGASGPVFAIASGLATLVIAAGIIMLGMGVYSGLKKTLADDSKMPVFTTPNVFILNKLILDERNEAVFDPEMFEGEELQRLVQVQFENGRKEEFRAPQAIFDSIGEGLRGTIVHQGKWISGFTMDRMPMTPEAGDPAWRPDPFARRDE